LISAAFIVLMLGVAASYRLTRTPWRQNIPCAAAGVEEARVLAQFLPEAPAERRFSAVFRYFAGGFVRHLSPGMSRVQYCGAGSVNGFAVNGLEGFARTAPLLGAWLYSGRPQRILDPADEHSIDLVAILKRGILNGVDPKSRDYWGDIGDNDQRIVEAADIARTLWLTRASIWDRLSDAEKLQVTRWLLQSAKATTPQDNWILFPIIVDLVLARLNAPAQEADLMARAQREFTRYKRLYLESGWFTDGSNGVDFYNPWGITYDLFWLNQVDPKFEPEFITAAIRSSATITEHLISPRGIPIMGRSVCYRTAVPVPILAAGFLNPPEAAPGRALRSLDAVWRYFLSHEALRDGALSQGYYGPDLRFLDDYSGAGSCQWGLRSLVLAFMHGAGEKFWTDAPDLLPVELADYNIEYPKIGWRIAGHVRSGEITLEILKNSDGVRHTDAYTGLDQILEVMLRRPFRPGNFQAKYASRFYSSAQPFPLVAQ
jgi:hypothetical protein